MSLDEIGLQCKRKYCLKISLDAFSILNALQYCSCPIPTFLDGG